MNKVFEQFGGLIAILKEVAEHTFIVGKMQVMPANDSLKFGGALNDIANMPISAKMGFAVALQELVGQFHIYVDCKDNADSNKIFHARLSCVGDIIPKEKSPEAYGRLAEEVVESILEEIIHHYITKTAKGNKIPQ